MRRLWFATYLLAASWLYAVPFYEPPRPFVSLTFVMFGSLLAALEFHSARATAGRAPAVVFLVPTTLAALLVPYPMNTGFVVAALGLACIAALRRARGAGAGILFAGIVLTAQSVAVAAYQMISPRSGDLGPLATVSGLLLRLLGAPARPGPEGLLLDNGLRTVTYGRTADMFALFAFGLFVAGGLVLLLRMRHRDWRPFVVFLGTMAAYVFARFVVLALMFSVSDLIELFWSARVTAISLLPLPFLLAGLVRGDLRYDVLGQQLPLRDRRFWVAVASAGLSAFALLGVLGFHDPGLHKQGRVIMNETHSDWEWSTQALDTSWYGEKSGYNYYSLYEYLDLFYEMQRNAKPIDDELLSGCDVLIIKPTTEPFAAEEIDSMARFVAAGGGLFLIGDHTNVFGSSTNMNPLAERFGLRFNHDATYELTKGQLSEYEPPAIFPHPIVQHLPLFLFATSSSMRVSAAANPVITGYGLKALPADYSQANFFPAVPNAADMRFGLLLQGAAVQFGRGRVAAFSDSTVFSNFWMFMPGKPELALSYVEWLNRTNAPYGALWIPLVLAVGLTVPFWVVRSRLPRGSAIWALALGVLIAIPVAVRAYPLLDRATYPLPDARRDYVAVCFEQEYSDIALPSTLEGFFTQGTESLHTFFVWNQRLGYVPSVERSLDQALRRGDVVVIANPGTAPGPDTIAEVEEFVKGGGRLLVLGDADGRGEAANSLLEPFGMSIDSPAAGSSDYCDSASRDRLALTASAGVVSGGGGLVRRASGESLCAFSKAGAGVVVACSDSGLFSDASLGSVSRVPSSQQRLVGELEFSIMRFLAEDEAFTF